MATQATQLAYKHTLNTRRSQSDSVASTELILRRYCNYEDFSANAKLWRAAMPYWSKLVTDGPDGAGDGQSLTRRGHIVNTVKLHAQARRDGGGGK